MTKRLFRADYIDLDSPVSLAEKGKHPAVMVAVEGLFTHPEYGKIDWSKDTLNEYLKNYHENIRGQRLPFNVEHDHDNPEGAAGYWGDAYLQEVKWHDGSKRLALFVEPEWNQYGLQLLGDKRFLYISPEFYTAWKHPETQAQHKNVMIAAALTTQPFIKGMSEVSLAQVLSEWITLSDAAKDEVIEKKTDKKRIDPFRDLEEMGFEEIMPHWEHVCNTLANKAKGKKGTPALRQFMNFSKKLLDNIHEQINKGGNKQMSDNTQEVVLKENNETEQELKALKEMQLKLQEELKAKNEALEQFKLNERKAEINKQLDALCPQAGKETYWIKAAERGKVEVFMNRLAEQDDMALRQLAEGKEHSSLLKEFVETVNNCFEVGKVHLKEEGSSHVEAEPATSKQALNEVVSAYAKEKNMPLHEAFDTMQKMGLLKEYN